MSQNQPERGADRETDWRKVFGIATGVIVGIWAINLMFAYWFKDADRYGDAVGVGNALFSGLAIAGVIVTLWMQRDALNLQRREFELQLEEFRNATKAHKKRNAFEAKVYRTRTTMDMLTEWDQLHAQSWEALVRAHVRWRRTETEACHTMAAEEEKSLVRLVGYFRKIVALAHNKAIDIRLWASHLDPEISAFFDDLVPSLEFIELPWKVDSSLETICDELWDLMAAVDPFAYGRETESQMMHAIAPLSSTPPPTPQSAGSHPADQDASPRVRPS